MMNQWSLTFDLVGNGLSCDENTVLAWSSMICRGFRDMFRPKPNDPNGNQAFLNPRAPGRPGAWILTWGCDGGGLCTCDGLSAQVSSSLGSLVFPAPWWPLKVAGWWPDLKGIILRRPMFFHNFYKHFISLRTYRLIDVPFLVGC